MASVNLAQYNSSVYDPNKLYGNYSVNTDENKAKPATSVKAIERARKSDNVSKESTAGNVSSILAEASKTFMSAVKSNSSILIDALKNMSSAEDDSAVNKVIGNSSDPEAVTMTNSVSKSSIESTNPIGINVHQVATTQKNGGNTALSANDNDFSSGNNRFAIDIGNKSYQFSFNNDSRSTNLSIQQHMADSINKKNIGLNAFVSYDEEDKESTLVVESVETGKNENASSVFALRDVVGNAASTSGIDKITREAQNAKYSIEGSDIIQTSRSNNVKVAEGVYTTLRKTTNEGYPVNISMNKDTTSVMNAAKNIVNSFNNLYDTATKTNDSGVANFASSLSGIAKTYKRSLNEIGISQNSEGRLKIDYNKLKAASENEKLEKFFDDDKRANSGFTNKLSQFAKAANENPSNYLSNKAKAEIGANAASYSASKNEMQFKNALNITFNPRKDGLAAAGSFYESMF